MKRLLVGGLAAILLLAGASGGPNYAAANSIQPPGTTLSAMKIAYGYWEQVQAYDWSVQKVVDPTSLTLGVGQTGGVVYTVKATRQAIPATTASRFGVRGQICVVNGGAVTTENLVIMDQVQYKTGSGKFENLEGAVFKMAPDPLPPNTKMCYEYDIPFIPVAGVLYRNTAQVTITNHAGWIPGSQNCPGPEACPFGPTPKTDFSLPKTPSIVYEDESATLDDVVSCPTGFSCTPSQYHWDLNDSATFTYKVAITNLGSGCGSWAGLINNAVLAESDTQTVHTAITKVGIYTGECPTGCTYTVGYWKNHPEFIRQYLPIWLGSPTSKYAIEVIMPEHAVRLLSKSGDASNGINKLYAQELAAKLNISAGADPSAVKAILAASDEFLASHNSNSWIGLGKFEQAQVLRWMTMLDDYNNGLTGPGHCQ